jgi:hypothetical protein
MANDSALEIVAYGAWNGGTVVDNSIYEQMQLQFKGGIPVNKWTAKVFFICHPRSQNPVDRSIGTQQPQPERY